MEDEDDNARVSWLSLAAICVLLEYDVYMDVIGAPTEYWNDKEHQFHEVDTKTINIPLVH